MSNPGGILIYAELLSNIRQVSVGCRLPSNCDTSTEARISADGTALAVSHQGEQRVLQLPGLVAGPATLSIQAKDNRALSWRLPLASSQTNFTSSGADDGGAPWSARDLMPQSSVCCRTCEATLVPEGVIKIWKDLPSENWAEMMEFWHCHKPHDHEKVDDHRLASRGYGANSRIAAQEGIGFVDLTSFLFLNTDCIETAFSKRTTRSETEQALKNGSSTENGANRTTENSSLHCQKCEIELGILNNQTASISLFKWQIRLHSSTTPSSSRLPSLAHCVSAMLLATLSRSGCSKSLLVPFSSTTSGQTQPLLHIWLFNSNIIYSSTETDLNRQIPAVKVLFQMVKQDEANKMLDSMTSDVQDIALPSEAVASVKQLLEQSNTYLAPGDRGFKEWTVGLLEKWTEKEG